MPMQMIWRMLEGDMLRMTVRCAVYGGGECIQQREIGGNDAGGEDKGRREIDVDVRVRRSRNTFLTTRNHTLARSISSNAPSICAFILRSISLRNARVSSSSSPCSVAAKETEEDRAELMREELSLFGDERYTDEEVFLF